MMQTGLTAKGEKRETYAEILSQLRSLLGGECDIVATLANAASLLKLAFEERFSWVGFYLARGNELVLGPFQGKPACVRIAFGKGVCGTAAASKKTLIVPDVEKFPGHIVCDPNSRSEIVVPMLRDSVVLGVLDVDSAQANAFDETDAEFLEAAVEIIVRQIQNPSI
jgi:L-methionine (R)-S-oxide reductase